jgi:CubicO group peptidase (beta-lactamase class C family)
MVQLRRQRHRIRKEITVRTRLIFIQTLILCFMPAAGLPGAAVVAVYRDQVTFQKGYGVRDLKTRAPVTPQFCSWRSAAS